VSCTTTSTLSAFATGSLEEAEAERIAEHVEHCLSCTQVLDDLSGGWQALRAAYRPQAASERLRSQVRWVTRVPERSSRPRPAWLAAGALAAVLVLAVGVGLSLRRAEATTLETIAVRAHEAYLSGAAPLDLRTGDPAALAAEFSRRLEFPLRLPPMAGVGLTLLGARLIQAGGQLAAMLVYQQGDEVLSLTVAPRGAVALADGEIERFRGVDFHFSELGGRHVVQWTEGSSSYALVSSVPGHTRTSCVICHSPGSGLSDVDEFHRPN
jgi:anti-sigma factor RsiW